MSEKELPAKDGEKPEIDSVPPLPFGMPQDLDPKSARLVAILTRSIHTEITKFSGPLPPPEVLAGYRDVNKSFPERIMSQFERQAAHRQKMETDVTRADSIRAYLGIASAFLLCALSIICGTILIGTGHDAGGTILGTSGLIGLAGTFIYGSITRRNERREKSKIMAGEKPSDKSGTVAEQPQRSL